MTAVRAQQVSVLLRQAGHVRAVPAAGNASERTAGYDVRTRDGVVLVTYWQDSRDPVGHLAAHLDEAIAARREMRAAYAEDLRAAGYVVEEGSFALKVIALAQ